MKIHAADLHGTENAMNEAERRALLRGVRAARAGPARERAVSGRRPAAPDRRRRPASACATASRS